MSKPLLLAAALATTVLVGAFAAPAHAQGDALTLNVTAKADDGEAYYFEVEGYEGKNPEIVIPAGAEVTVNFVNDGATVHNVWFNAPVDKGTEVIPAGESESFTFTAPTDVQGTTYVCVPHEFMGMGGTVTFEGADTTTPTEPTGPTGPTSPTNDDGGDDETQDAIPAPGAVVAALAALGAALLVARRRA